MSRDDLPRVNKCTVTENGLCAMHGVEVERRENSQKQIDEIKEDIEENHRHIGELLTFKNNFEGQRTVVAAVALVLVLGAYYYNFISDQDREGEMTVLRNDITVMRAEHGKMRSEISDFRTRLAVTDERFQSVSAQLGMLNGRLSQLIEIINDKIAVKRVRLENDESK